MSRLWDYLEQNKDNDFSMTVNKIMGPHDYERSCEEQKDEFYKKRNFWDDVRHKWQIKRVGNECGPTLGERALLWVTADKGSELSLLFLSLPA